MPNVPIIRNTSCVIMWYQLAKEKLPNSQKKIVYKSSLCHMRRRVTKDETNEDIAVPARRRETIGGAEPFPREMKKTVDTVSNDPAKAITVIPVLVENMVPRIMERAAPSDAPDDAPMIYGSASGFLKIPWNAAPLIPNDHPARTERSTLGNLNCIRMVL